MATKIQDRLIEYPETQVVEADEQVLADCMTEGDGTLLCVTRDGGRFFCRALMIHDNPQGTGEKRSALRFTPRRMRNPNIIDGGTTDREAVVQQDETWNLYEGLKDSSDGIVTGEVHRENRQPLFRRGISHVLTPNGELVNLNDLICLNPGQTIGPMLEEQSRRCYGRPALGITSKKFANEEDIQHHEHRGWRKREVYDTNIFDNPHLAPGHQFWMPTGFKSGATLEDILFELMAFEDEAREGNILSLAGQQLLRLGWGYKMLEQIFHSPKGGVVHHETHGLDDEHLLGQKKNGDVVLSTQQVWFAVRTRDIPKKYQEDWKHYVYNYLDLARNQDVALQNSMACAPLHAPEHSGDGVHAYWPVHGLMAGTQHTSVLRVRVDAGASGTLHFDNAGFLHMNRGGCQVAGHQLNYEKVLDVGQIARELLVLTKQAVNGGIQLSNTSTKPAWFTIDFPHNAHRVTPGTSHMPDWAATPSDWEGN